MNPDDETVMTFSVSRKEYNKYCDWLKQRKEAGQYEGAIGGSYTWQFTPTGIGTVVKVLNNAGTGNLEERTVDVTDYWSW